MTIARIDGKKLLVQIVVSESDGYETTQMMSLDRYNRMKAKIMPDFEDTTWDGTAASNQHAKYWHDLGIRGRL